MFRYVYVRKSDLIETKHPKKDQYHVWGACTTTKTILGYGFECLRNVESDNHSFQITKKNHTFPDFNENV